MLNVPNFDWVRYFAFHRAASKRYTRQLSKGYSLEKAQQNYEKVMLFCQGYLVKIAPPRGAA